MKRINILSIIISLIILIPIFLSCNKKTIEDDLNEWSIEDDLNGWSEDNKTDSLINFFIKNKNDASKKSLVKKCIMVLKYKKLTMSTEQKGKLLNFIYSELQRDKDDIEWEQKFQELSDYFYLLNFTFNLNNDEYYHNYVIENKFTITDSILTLFNKYRNIKQQTQSAKTREDKLKDREDKLIEASNFISGNNIISINFIIGDQLDADRILISVGGYKIAVLETYYSHDFKRGVWYNLNVRKTIGNYEEFKDRFGFTRKYQVYEEVSNDIVDKYFEYKEILYKDINDFNLEDDKLKFENQQNEIVKKIRELLNQRIKDSKLDNLNSFLPLIDGEKIYYSEKFLSFLKTYDETLIPPEYIQRNDDCRILQFGNFDGNAFKDVAISFLESDKILFFHQFKNDSIVIHEIEPYYDGCLFLASKSDYINYIWFEDSQKDSEELTLAEVIKLYPKLNFSNFSRFAYSDEDNKIHKVWGYNLLNDAVYESGKGDESPYYIGDGNEYEILFQCGSGFMFQVRQKIRKIF